MRILVAGASGAIGKAIVPLAVGRGHVVGGLIRNPAHADLIAGMGADPLLADALDSRAVTDTFQRFRPDAVAHQMTALPKDADLRDFDGVFRATNRLRTEGTDNLVTASRTAGVRRFVAQSFCGWTFAREGGPVKSEDDPLDPRPPTAFAHTLDALRYVERAMDDASDLRGVALRYGAFYGRGTMISGDGAIVRDVRRRRLPLVGSGLGLWSFIHIDDAAEATLAALEGTSTGTFQVVDDHPAPVREWLPGLATLLGAKQPHRLPGWIARFILPAHLRIMMTEMRGAANGRFRGAFGWAPAFPSWREGFAAVLAERT